MVVHRRSGPHRAKVELHLNILQQPSSLQQGRQPDVVLDLLTPRGRRGAEGVERGLVHSVVSSLAAVSACKNTITGAIVNSLLGRSRCLGDVQVGHIPERHGMDAHAKGGCVGNGGHGNALAAIFLQELLPVQRCADASLPSRFHMLHSAPEHHWLAQRNVVHEEIHRLRLTDPHLKNIAALRISSKHWVQHGVTPAPAVRRINSSPLLLLA
mmetsp:Transcript_19810/g.33322  ORF Transcript_19810/g.33322 Transcript_19810/m.33322 type:complete len:212 (-) Transcript_19810:1245-1880(-)